MEYNFRDLILLLENKDFLEILKDCHEQTNQFLEAREREDELSDSVLKNKTYPKFTIKTLASVLRIDKTILESFICTLNIIKNEKCSEILWKDFENNSNIELQRNSDDIFIENKESSSIIVIENQIDTFDLLENIKNPKKIKGKYKKVYLIRLVNRIWEEEFTYDLDSKNRENLITLYTYIEEKKNLSTFIEDNLESIEDKKFRSNLKDYVELSKRLMDSEEYIDKKTLKNFYEYIKDKDVDMLENFSDNIDKVKKLKNFNEHIKDIDVDILESFSHTIVELKSLHIFEEIVEKIKLNYKSSFEEIKRNLNSVFLKCKMDKHKYEFSLLIHIDDDEKNLFFNLYSNDEKYGKKMKGKYLFDLKEDLEKDGYNKLSSILERPKNKNRIQVLVFSEQYDVEINTYEKAVSTTVERLGNIIRLIEI